MLDFYWLIRGKTSEALNDYYTNAPADAEFLSSNLESDLLLRSNLVFEDNNTTLKYDDGSVTTIDLDTIVLDGKSYRQLFETLNTLECSAGFVEGTLPSFWYPYNETTPMPSVVSGSETPGSIGQNILKCFSNTAQSIRSVQAMIPMDQTVPFTRETKLFQFCRAKCTRWVTGVLGISKSNVVDSRSALVGGVTEDWTVCSGVWDYGTSSTEPGNLECVGSIKTANLDGYIDLPVVIRSESFTVVPTIDELTEAYNTYLEIKLNGPIIIPNQTILVHDNITSFNREDCYALTNEDTDFISKIPAYPHIQVDKDVARQAFYEEMNMFAQQLGMSNSNFVSAAGWTSDGAASANTITTNDMARLGMKGLDYPQVCTIWNCFSKTIKSTGLRRTIELNSTVVDHGGWADYMKTDYMLLGGKTGTANGCKNYCITMQAKDTDDVFTVATSMTATETASVNRHINAKKLADIGKLLRAAGEYAITDSDNIQDATCKAAVKEIEASLFDSGDCNYGTVLLTPTHPGSYDGIDIYDATNPCSIFLYSHGGDTTFSAASTTKMLTMLIVMNWIPDLHDTITMTREDWLFGGGSGGSGPEFYGGEVLTYDDLLYALMLPSSNASAEAMARTVGQKIYSSKHRDYDPTKLYLTKAMCGTPAQYLGGYESPRNDRLTTASNTEACGILLKAGESITFTGLAPTGVDPLKIDYVYAISAGPNPLLSAGAWAQAVSSGRIDNGGTAADGFPLNRDGNNNCTYTNDKGQNYYYFFNFASAIDDTRTLAVDNYTINFSIQ